MCNVVDDETLVAYQLANQILGIYVLLADLLAWIISPVDSPLDH